MKKFLSLLLVLLLMLPAAALADTKIAVTGSATVQAEPDMVTLSLGVEETKSDVAAAQAMVNEKLSAVIEALTALKEPCDVTLTSDSKDVLDAIEKGWARSWKRNGWRKADKKPALNADLWDRLLTLLDIHTVRLVWVRGHQGHPENERCDQLAVGYYQRWK